MAFANVNIGSNPADGTGDPLRTAFSKINQNFANITAGAITVNAPVLSVAGRTGNIRLVVSDITGAASNAYVNTMTTAANTAAAAAIVTANTGMKSYVDSLTIGGGTTYTDANVALYLPGHTGNVGANAVTAVTLSGTLTPGAQDNITSVGTLDNLIVAGPTTLHGNLIFTTGELLTGNLYISGNVFLAGNRTTIDSEHISTTTRHIVLVSNVTDDADALGAGILTPFCSWTFNHITEAWQSNVNVLPSQPNTLTMGSFGSPWHEGHFANIYGNVKTAAQVGITTLGNLTALSVVSDASIYGNLTSFGSFISAGNVIPRTNTVYNSLGSSVRQWDDVFVSGNVSGTVSTTSQPYIRTLGNLASLNIDDDLRVGGDIDIFGNTNIWSNVFVNGANTFVAQGNVSLLGNVVLGRYGNEFGNTTVIVSSFTEFRDNVIIYSNLTTGTSESTLNVIGNLSVNGNMLYTMGNYQNWTSNVGTISSALDQLAARLKAAGF